MQIYFLHHSAVCVLTDGALLVFDHFRHNPKARLEDGAVGMDDIAAAKRAYVFVSHAHPDHFNPRIFEWANGHVKFILDATVPKKGSPKDAVFLRRGETYDDKYVNVRAFGSTDQGGSFYLSCEGTSFFHAGDLNDWHWRDEGNARYSRVMSRLFARELRHLKRHITDIDYAFFPVDRRMGTDFDAGARLFIKTMRPRCFVPIHFVDFADTQAFSQKYARSGTRVLEVRENGQRLV